LVAEFKPNAWRRSEECNVKLEERSNKKEYLKDEINEIELNSKNKIIRGLYRGIDLNEFKKDLLICLQITTIFRIVELLCTCGLRC
jgi:hypothetical protein